jgi:hypothetical protein
VVRRSQQGVEEEEPPQVPAGEAMLSNLLPEAKEREPLVAQLRGLPRVAVVRLVALLVPVSSQFPKGRSIAVRRSQASGSRGASLLRVGLRQRWTLL